MSGLDRDDKAARAAAWRQEGIRICIGQIQQIREIDGVAGVHIMGIEWEESIRPLPRAPTCFRAPVPQPEGIAVAITQTQTTNIPCPGMGRTGPAPLPELVLGATGSNPYKCYQCIKCTSGCPLADQFDLAPHQVMRSVQFNDTAVLESRAIWLCASCQTCTTRCPQQIDVTGVMDALRIESRRRGIEPAVPEIARFNELFMALHRIFGRAWNSAWPPPSTWPCASPCGTRGWAGGCLPGAS